MVLPLEKKEDYFTYSDYLDFPDDVRYELIDGEPYLMSAPSIIHQRISSQLHIQFGNFLKDKPCQVFAAPTDVRLNANSYDDTVVQPDILVVCDKNKIGDKAIIGTPDLVIEITSPSTSKYDRVTKFNLYRKAGVHEYWIVDTENNSVQVHILKEGEYVIASYDDTDKVSCTVLSSAGENCIIDLASVFPKEQEFKD